MGGADAEFRTAIIDGLNAAGINAVDAADPANNLESLSGAEWSNICNQGPNGGVQIEMSNTLRNSLFADGDASSRIGRSRPSAIFGQLVETLATVTEFFLVEE